jgi:hypothetical protein
MMDYKDKEDIQVASLKKLLEGIGPILDKAQDEEFEAKGWQKGFLEFIKILEQVSARAGQKQGFREGVEFYQKSLMGEIELQKVRYQKLRDAQSEGNSPDVHPDDRIADLNERKEEVQEEVKKEEIQPKPKDPLAQNRKDLRRNLIKSED